MYIDLDELREAMRGFNPKYWEQAVKKIPQYTLDDLIRLKQEQEKGN